MDRNVTVAIRVIPHATPTEIIVRTSNIAMASRGDDQGHDRDHGLRALSDGVVVGVAMEMEMAGTSGMLTSALAMRNLGQAITIAMVVSGSCTGMTSTEVVTTVMTTTADSGGVHCAVLKGFGWCVCRRRCSRSFFQDNLPISMITSCRQ
jgi:hypothetical protein